MQKKAEVKKRKTNCGLMWQYDDQSGQVSERQKKVTVKTRQKSKEELNLNNKLWYKFKQEAQRTWEKALKSEADSKTCG